MGRTSPLLIVIFSFIILLRQAVAQAVDPDVVDFSTIDGYDDLRECVQNRLYWIGGDVGCSTNADGYYTNACLCRPSTLGSAVQIIQQKTMEDCENIDDKNIAKTILLNWCSSKGYTSVVTPIVLPSLTGGYTVTATVTAIVTQSATSAAIGGGNASNDALRSIHPLRELYKGATVVFILFFAPFLCGRWLTSRSL